MTIKRDNWTNEKIKEQIMKMVNDLGMDRMPSSKEVEGYFGNCKLTNAISHRKAWYKFAEELNLPIKESETAFGKSYESQIMEKLICMGHEVEKMPQNFPYDLLVDGALKIDVKASSLYRGKNGNFYSYNLEKPYATCDIYILMLIKNYEVKDILVVPSKFVMTNTQISVGEFKSKYYKYSQKWDYMDEYLNFLEAVK